MATRKGLALLHWPLLLTPLLVALSTPHAWAGDSDAEREQLAAVIRQLTITEHLAVQTAARAAPAGTRYHFDYARLQQDLQRIRQGIEHYLTPSRAQPRDPQPLAGDYAREVDPHEASSP